jgi:hypothetical protein
MAASGGRIAGLGGFVKNWWWGNTATNGTNWTKEVEVEVEG